MELIQERLQAIEVGIRLISPRPRLPPGEVSPGQHASATISGHSPRITSPAFEGDTSFTAHTVRASEAATKAVQNQHSQNAETARVLSALRNSMKFHESLQLDETQLSRRNDTTSQPPQDLLPVEFVVAVLKRMKGSSITSFDAVILLTFWQKSRPSPSWCSHGLRHYRCNWNKFVRMFTSQRSQWSLAQ